MFGRKRFITKTYTNSSPKRLNKITEDDMNRMAKDDYIPHTINDENVGFLGVTTSQIRTVVYVDARRGV